MKFWFLIGVYAVISTLGLLLIKTALNLNGAQVGSLLRKDTLGALLTEGYFLPGFVLYAGGFLIWLYILSRKDLSLAFPIASGVLYLGLLMGSSLWLHEKVGIIRISGILLILVGIILVSRS